MFQKNVECAPLKNLSSWRRISLSTWARPKDPSIYGVMEVDMTRVLKLLEKLAREASERGRLHPALPVEGALTAPTMPKITLTHLMTKAVALTMAKHPEINVLIRRGRLYARENIDIFVQVFLEEKGKSDLSGAKVRNAHQKSLSEIARELGGQSEKIREGLDPNLKQTKHSLKWLSPRLLRWGLRLLEFVNYDLNLRPKFLKLPPDPFGAVMISNVGMFGLKTCWAPLVPFSRTPIVLLVGEVTEQAAVENGQVVVKPLLDLGVTVDHRIIDGYLAGKAAATLKGLLEEPEALTRK